MRGRDRMTNVQGTPEIISYAKEADATLKATSEKMVNVRVSVTPAFGSPYEYHQMFPASIWPRKDDWVNQFFMLGLDPITPDVVRITESYGTISWTEDVE